MLEGRRLSVIFSVMCLMVLGSLTSAISEEKAPPKGKTLKVSETLSATVQVLRSEHPEGPRWKAALGALPEESYYYWRLDDLTMGSSGVIRGNTKIKTFATGSEFSRTEAEIQEPDGEFIEIVLVLHNEADEVETFTLSKLGNGHPLNVRLTDGKPDLSEPVDFVFPGMDGWKLGAIESLHKEGRVRQSRIELKEGGKVSATVPGGKHTFAFFLFDAPKGTAAVRFVLADQKPLDLDVK